MVQPLGPRLPVMGAQAPTMAAVPPPPVQWAAEPVNVYEPNFGLLASDGSWRTTWATIIAGRFSSSPYSGFLFVEQGTGYAELYQTDGSGRIVTPLLGAFNPLGGQAGWTHIVPGYFGPSGLCGLLLYDSVTGTGQFLDSDGHGHFLTLSTYSGWRTAWSHIVAGRFVYQSPPPPASSLAPPCLYSSVFFYSASENYAEIWGIDGTGLDGTAPYQALADFSDSSFTHVVAGDFHWTPGYAISTPTLTDVFCYDAAAGHGEMFRCDLTADNGPSVLVTPAAAASDSLPVAATSVIAGNFGGAGNTDLCFHDGPSGTLSFYSFEDLDDYTAEMVLHETQAGLRPTASLAVAGMLSMPDSEDHKFNDGPPASGSPPYDPQWRFGTGAFSGVLLYDQEAGLGEFYFHGPLPPPAVPLDGYVSSQTKSDGTQPVSTGSVVPGESIDIHVSSQVGPYSITIYQRGYFTGATTEREMATIDGLPVDPAPLPVGPTAYRDGAGWPAAATFVVPDWPNGLYVARVQAASTPDEIDLPFVVRPSAPAARVALVLADTTYHAYNDWGGRSAYVNVSGPDLAGAFPSTTAYRVPFGFHLSFDRPFHGGFGNSVQAWEVPFLQWLGRRGIPVDVCTARDLHFGYLKPGAYQLVMFAGHHEYWTAEMRNSVETFTHAGGSVAFFCGNTCWWQIRVSPDGSQLTCYKVAGFDPLSTTPDQGLTTVHWFDDPVNRPETTMTGVSWYGDEGLYGDPDHRFTMKQASHWAFTGTGLHDGDPFGEYGISVAPLPPNALMAVSRPATVGSVCGTESDRAQPVPFGPTVLNSPLGYTLASIYSLATPHLEVGTMGAFSPALGAGTVFNAATINWALGLSQDELSWNTIDQITANVIGGLSGYRPALPWTSVSQGSTTPGAPVAAVVTGPGQVSLFLADPGGGVYTAGGVPAEWGPWLWGTWTSVSQGSTTPGAPVTAVVTGPGQVSLFLADPGGGVYTTSGGPAGWGPWTSVSQGSTTPGAPVTAVVTGPGQVSLFLADPGGGVYTTSGGPAGWGPWTSVSQGSTTPGAPVTAVVTGPGQVSLFLADPGGGVYTTSGGPAGWGPWTSVSQGSTTPGAPVTAVVTGPGQVSLFLADPGGGVYTTSGGPAGWGPWTSVLQGSTTPGAPVTAVVTGPGQVSLFLANPHGGVYTTVKG